MDGGFIGLRVTRRLKDINLSAGIFDLKLFVPLIGRINSSFAPAQYPFYGHPFYDASSV
jgi:hypothetical protein